MERKQTTPGQENVTKFEGVIPVREMPYHTSTKKKPGFTTPCGLWDGETGGGILYANDEEYARYLKEREEKGDSNDGIDIGDF